MDEIVEIEDGDLLYRRLLKPDHVYDDGTVKSNAYKLNGKPDPSLSLDLARLTSPHEASLRGRKPPYGIGQLPAGVPRAFGLTVRHQPDVENANPAHSLIEGMIDAKIHRATCDQLALATQLIILPPDPSG